jgi:hypothetical protein
VNVTKNGKRLFKSILLIVSSENLLYGKSGKRNYLPLKYRLLSFRIFLRILPLDLNLYPRMMKLFSSILYHRVIEAGGRQKRRRVRVNVASTGMHGRSYF